MTINSRADFMRRFSMHPSLPAERRIDEPLRKRLRPAAVLIPIIERPHGLSLILTRRSSKLRKHAGQISFPGGRFDETDSDLLDTALRETEEEIGLPRSQVEVIGRLHDYPVLSYFMIRPYVAFVSPQQPLVAEESEVAEIFEVPLADILDHGNHYVYRIRKFIYDRVYFIPWQHRNIWGATAGILRELSEQLQPDGKNHFRPLN
ncbi:CoA pyrophosphatase [Idiomarina sp. PL1-037]|uniref:CoA pyrophosphatase n=1 Tax=unclassified Idiomarina TaxID=2614829 RepID=UPI00294B0671|nr:MULTISPECIES: CoA pyrophosphatase [unclassified Idiomarina]MDV6328756.1 CoA pyrophosphatase [Idiomarina sp. Sol25]WQC52140.1 CoA pyrophosphatase [Idiomarina sp. PL1-037]